VCRVCGLTDLLQLVETSLRTPGEVGRIVLG
jgi:hypothetical protein